MSSGELIPFVKLPIGFFDDDDDLDFVASSSGSDTDLLEYDENASDDEFSDESFMPSRPTSSLGHQVPIRPAFGARSLADLPVEIQIQIWRESMEPATVSIRCIDGIGRYSTMRLDHVKDELAPAVPSQLLTSCRSHAVVKPLYTLSFSGVTNRPEYFNPEVDFLALQEAFLQSEAIIEDTAIMATAHPLHNRLSLLADFDKVQNLIVWNTRWSHRLFSPDVDFCERVREFRRFKDLKYLEIRILYDGGRCEHFDHEEWIKELWSKVVNPRRIALGEPANPPPVVVVRFWDDIHLFDKSPHEDY